MKRTMKVLGLLAALIAPGTEAAILSLTQTWIDEVDPLRTATTFTQWDDSAITGLGSEQALVLNSFWISLFYNGVGQVFARNAPFELPLDEQDLIAQYVDGIFTGIGNFSSGGSPRVPVIDQSNGNGAGGLSIASSLNGGQIVWWLPVSGTWRFAMDSATLKSTAQVPAPGALLLMSSAIVALRLRRLGSGQK